MRGWSAARENTPVAGSSDPAPPHERICGLFSAVSFPSASLCEEVGAGSAFCVVVGDAFGGITCA